MEDIKQFVIDYVEGRVDSKSFIAKLQDDPSVILWLQSIVPEGKIGYSDVKTRPDGTWYQEKVPYDVKDYVDTILGQVGETEMGKAYNLHENISSLLLESFPDDDIVPSQTLKKRVNFLLSACPDYIYSQAIENSGIFEKLMDELPESMPKTRRIKTFKEKLKAMFYIEGQKYPRWAQESEWPLSKTGKPTKFLRQQTQSNGELCDYYFLDVDTGEEIKITQAY